MGIVGLSDMIKKKCPHVVRPLTNLGVLKGRVLAIDAMVSVHSLLSGVRNNMAKRLDAERILSANDDIMAIIEREEAQELANSFANQAQMFTRNGITAIYVFDGKAHQCKSQEQAKRREVKDHRRKLAETEAREIIGRSVTIPVVSPKGDDAGLSQPNPGQEQDVFVTNVVTAVSTVYDAERLSTALRVYQQVRKVGDVHIACIKKRLAELPGVAVLIAPGEGERMCSYLCHRGYADALVTNDSDALAMEGRIMIKGLTGTTEPSLAKPFYIINIREARLALGFPGEHGDGVEHSAFVDFCLLSGSDFDEYSKIPGVGPETAHEMMRTHGSIEKFLKSSDGSQARRNARKKEADMKKPLDFDLARQQFLGPLFASDEEEDAYFDQVAQAIKESKDRRNAQQQKQQQPDQRPNADSHQVGQKRPNYDNSKNMVLMPAKRPRRDTSAATRQVVPPTAATTTARPRPQ
ncbi:Flap Endonuclease-1 [Mollivirus sibericum]|uniref:Flap Endonuclease-1 n=1 Tax=Mollivirus sibericum TaxID=1678078 RepID=UPI0006B2EB15|nr:Flap Endonuclease-1 [Mollivirus sibericum]ALD62184.1 Flap Endonuclease-1 [Mollivirus sibericum]